MNTTEILDAIKDALIALETNHNGKYKSSRGKAKSAANTIKKLAAQYKKTSDEEFKAIAE
jgi:acyl-CoA reductase-like NAD-dependent aldehyde dehydrogenase